MRLNRFMLPQAMLSLIITFLYFGLTEIVVKM